MNIKGQWMTLAIAEGFVGGVIRHLSKHLKEDQPTFADWLVRLSTIERDLQAVREEMETSDGSS